MLVDVHILVSMAMEHAIIKPLIVYIEETNITKVCAMVNSQIICSADVITNGLFSVDAVSGTATVEGSLDREISDTFSFDVEVQTCDWLPSDNKIVQNVSLLSSPGLRSCSHKQFCYHK